MIIAAAAALALLGQPSEPNLSPALTGPLIAEDGAFQRRRGPLTLGVNDTVSVWTAAVPQPAHAETLATAFRRYEIDCPATRIRRREGYSLAPGASEAQATDGGDSEFSYPGSQPAWVGQLLVDVCSPAD